MTKREFAMLAMAMQSFYPKEKLLETNEAKSLWFSQLEDIPYDVAETGLEKWVATHKWSPSVADIREMAADVIAPEIPDWGQAWGEVLKAISLYGHDRGKEAMEYLPKLAAETVDRMGWYNLCVSENISVERANFRQIYESLVEKEKEQAKLPPALKEKIKMLGGGNNEKSLPKLP